MLLYLYSFSTPPKGLNITYLIVTISCRYIFCGSRIPYILVVSNFAAIASHQKVQWFIALRPTGAWQIQRSENTHYYRFSKVEDSWLLATHTRGATLPTMITNSIVVQVTYVRLACVGNTRQRGYPSHRDTTQHLSICPGHVRMSSNVYQRGYPSHREETEYRSRVYV